MVSSLKNKFFVSGILFLFVFFANCSYSAKQEEKAVADSANCEKPKPLNPNGDSELALLMRKMMHASESMKEMVLQGNVPKEFPEEFMNIHTAKPTDSETKKASFDGFAGSYISNVKTFVNSPKEELTKNYNAMITACVNCHSEHCPGPLKAINKLKISE